MRGAIAPLPNTPSWRGAQLKHRDNFTFTFISEQSESSQGARNRFPWSTDII
jgi:hypothetical protein